MDGGKGLCQDHLDRPGATGSLLPSGGVGRSATGGAMSRAARPSHAALAHLLELSYLVTWAEVKVSGPMSTPFEDS